MKTMIQAIAKSSVVIITVAGFNAAVMAAEMDHSKMGSNQMEQGNMDNMNMGSKKKKSGGMKCGGGMDMSKGKKAGMNGMNSMKGMKGGMKCGGMSGSKMNFKAMSKKLSAIKLKKKAALPASGKSREAGSDGKYNMEATSSKDSVATQCAKASRGIVMVDNATWARCGGKPKGWAAGPGNAKKMDHSKHNM